jgi:hypothetical protein
MHVLCVSISNCIVVIGSCCHYEFNVIVLCHNIPVTQLLNIFISIPSCCSQNIGSFSLTDESSAHVPPISSWQPGAVAWDPHQSHSCAVVSGKSELRIVDTRKMQAATVVKGIHRGYTRYGDVYMATEYVF